jgi:hypothetical protein
MAKKDYEGVGDKTEPLPGMLDPISQAKMDKKKKEQETKPKGYKSGGMVGSASKRADGCCVKGKTRGKMV